MFGLYVLNKFSFVIGFYLLQKTNVFGGAIANGHPLGASGAKLMTTLLNVLERKGGRYGLLTMCIGFGQATATVIDRDV